MMVSVSILVLIMLVVFQIIQSTSRLWSDTSGKLESSRGARASFELMTSQLRQATTNTYWDYFNSTGQPRTPANKADFNPVAYGRQSELHFICGPNLLTSPAQVTHAVFFQCPLGVAETEAYAPMNSLLNECGYFVTFGSDHNVINGPPTFLDAPDHYRYRLMQFNHPTESLKVYDRGPTSFPNGWFTTPLVNNPQTSARILAENIIALIIWPMSEENDTSHISPDFKYDSRNTPAFRSTAAGDWSNPLNPQPYPLNQMPPLLRVILVAIDEKWGSRLQAESAVPSSPPTRIQDLLNGKFKKTIDLETNLKDLRDGLSNNHIEYRIYDASISVRSAKFSEQ